MFDFSKFSDVGDYLSLKNCEENNRSAISRYYYSVFGSVRIYLVLFLNEFEFLDNFKVHLRICDRMSNSGDNTESEIGEILGGTELESDSDNLEDILKAGDKNIQESDITTNSVDTNGFLRVKEDLESMGLVVEYKIFKLPSFDVIIAIWEDKNEIPPLYVEVTVSEDKG